MGRTENQLDSISTMNDNKFYDAAVLHNLHHIPAIEELALDLGNMKINDTLLTGIVDSVTRSN